MNVETLVIDISARMLVKEAPGQCERAIQIIKEAVERINAELPAIEATIGTLLPEEE